MGLILTGQPDDILKMQPKNNRYEIYPGGFFPVNNSSI